MPRNFDELLGEDHTFIVRGETFTYRDISPRQFKALDDVLEDRINGKAKTDPRSDIDRFAEQIGEILVPEDKDRWMALYMRDDEPVTFAQIVEIRNFLMQTLTQRDPTTPLSDSGNGPGKAEASSTARSS